MFRYCLVQVIVRIAFTLACCVSSHGAHAVPGACPSRSLTVLNIVPPAVMPDLTADLVSAGFAFMLSDIASHLKKSSVVVSSYNGVSNAINDCTRLIRFELSQTAPSNEQFANQGFAIVVKANTAVITAKSAIGLIYGGYEFMEKLGYHWLAPDDTIIPLTINWPDDKQSISVLSPGIEFRGFLTYGETVDARFVTWAVRNKFNMLGANVANNAQMHMFGIQRTAGGHDAFSKLAYSSKIVAGTPLIESHPEWFGNTSLADPLPKDANNYGNPCFADPGFIEYFASQLDIEIDSGIYKDADLINIWPADSPLLAIPKSCYRPIDGMSDVAQLFHFYKGVTETLAVRRHGKRPITIAGIGYYDTFDLQPVSEGWPQDAGNTKFLLQFYPIERSFAEGGMFGTSQLNRKQVARIDIARDHFSQTGSFGVVDYHNLSSYLGMVAPSIDTLSAELDQFHKRGFSHYSYMHPLDGSSICENILKHVFARKAFMGESVDIIRQEIAEEFFGADAQILPVLGMIDSAFSDKTELVGVGSSLDLILRAPLIWKNNKFFTRAEGVAMLQNLVSGQQQVMPPMRLGALAPVTFNGKGLHAAISMLGQAKQKLEQMIATSAQSVRLSALRSEVMRSKLVFETLDNLVTFAASSVANDDMARISAEEAFNQKYQEALAQGWPGTVTGFAQKDLFVRNYGDILEKLRSVYTP